MKALRRLFGAGGENGQLQDDPRQHSSTAKTAQKQQSRQASRRLSSKQMGLQPAVLKRPPGPEVQLPSKQQDAVAAAAAAAAAAAPVTVAQLQSAAPAPVRQSYLPHQAAEGGALAAGDRSGKGLSPASRQLYAQWKELEEQAAGEEDEAAPASLDTQAQPTASAPASAQPPAEQRTPATAGAPPPSSAPMAAAAPVVLKQQKPSARPRGAAAFPADSASEQHPHLLPSVRAGGPPAPLPAKPSLPPGAAAGIVPAATAARTPPGSLPATLPSTVPAPATPSSSNRIYGFGPVSPAAVAPTGSSRIYGFGPISPAQEADQLKRQLAAVCTAAEQQQAALQAELTVVNADLSDVAALLEEHKQQLAAAADREAGLDSHLCTLQAKAAAAQQREEVQKQRVLELVAQTEQLKAAVGVQAAAAAALNRQLRERERRIQALELEAARREEACQRAEQQAWEQAKQEIARLEQQHAAEAAAWEAERQQLFAKWRAAAANTSALATQRTHQLADARAWRKREQLLLAQLAEARRTSQKAGAQG